MTLTISPPEAGVAKIAVQESDLVSQARSGDLKAFTALVGLYQDRAVRTAYSFAGNFEDARDLAQEAFVKAFENFKNFKAESRFYTWFYRILSNACKDFLRKKKVRSAISFWIHRKEDSEEEAAEHKIADSSKNAKEQLLNQELSGQLYEAMDRLPSQQKNAFILRYIEGMSLDEVSESMGLSVGAVKAHLWQAAQKMRKFLSLYLATEVH